MKFEEVLPLMRQGKKAYLTKCVHSWWEGKEKYFLQYFESVKDFKSKYPDTRLRIVGDPPTEISFLACFMNDIHSLVEDHEDGSFTDIPEEVTYLEYLNSPHETHTLYEDGLIEFIKINNSDESVYLDHRNKCVMGDYYLNPSVMHYDMYFYSPIIVGSEWEVFDY